MIEIQVLESFFLLCMHKNYIPCVCVCMCLFIISEFQLRRHYYPQEKKTVHTHTSLTFLFF